MHRTIIVFTILVMALSLSLLLGCKGVDRDKPMARIEDKVITIGDFMDYYARASKEEDPENRPLMETVEDVEAFLKIVLIKEAMYLEAEKLGYFDDSKFQSKYQIKLNELSQLALKDEITAPVFVTEEEIKDFYSKSFSQYHVYVIHTSKKSVAEEARERVLGGEDFLEVLKELSIDYNEAYRMEPLIIRYGLDELHQEIFKLKKGEISKPIADPGGFGYLVFQAVDITDFEVGEYDDAKDQIYNYILETKKKEALDEYRENLLEKHNFQINEEAMEIVLYGSEEELFTAYEKETVASTAGDYQCGIDIIAIDGYLPQPLREKLDEDVEYVRDAIITRLKDVTSNHLLVEESYSRDYASREDIAKELHELKEKHAVDKLYQEQFYPQIPKPAKEEVIEYYNTHMDKFSDEENVKTVLIRVSTEEEALQVIKDVEETGERTRAVKEYSIDEASRDQEFSPGMVTLYRDDPNYPEASAEAFALEPNTHSDPIPTPNGYDIIWVVQYNEAYQEDINDETTYKNALRYIMAEREGSEEIDEKCRMWMEEILNNYDWEMFEDTFQEVLRAAKEMQKEINQ